jgi:prevent-host-death family protein
MAKSKSLAKPLVGVKELKDQASAILDEVERTRRPVWITRNQRRIAQIIPVAETSDSPLERMKEAGFLRREAARNWKDLELLKVSGGSASGVAVQAILKEREEKN